MKNIKARITINNLDELQEELKRANELTEQLKDSLTKISSWKPEL